MSFFLSLKELLGAQMKKKKKEWAVRGMLSKNHTWSILQLLICFFSGKQFGKKIITCYLTASCLFLLLWVNLNSPNWTFLAPLFFRGTRKHKRAPFSKSAGPCVLINTAPKHWISSHGAQADSEIPITRIFKYEEPAVDALHTRTVSV